MDTADPGASGSALTAPPAVGDVRTVAVVGTGVIGAGWAAHFLGRGFDVVAFDPGPGAEARLGALVDNAWPALERVGLTPGARRDRLTFASSLGEALARADFVQESTPENLDAKVRILAEIDEAAPAGVVVASSTSGFAMTDMQAGCRTPDRFVVGHPFNPPYLIPLVEVVGGKATSPAAVGWAGEFYRAAGKSPLTMDREVPGFVGNRLQEALWREALHMVAAGEATVEQVDAAITEGPGLRWALMGPCLTFHLAGGPGGMAHMLDHFGPALLEPWTRLTAPELTPALRDQMVAGSAREAAGRTIAELERERDAFLVDLLLLRERHADRWRPAGGAARAAGDGGGAERPDPRQAPFAAYRTRVRDEWIDYNGHMTDTAYAVVCAEATEVFLDALGLGAAYQAETGCTTYTVESRIRYLREAGRGAALHALTTLTEADPKRLRVRHSVRDGDGTEIAAGEFRYLHVDQGTGRVAPMPAGRWAQVAEVLAAHA
jgi:carnitine 3-dehydrogenase